MDSLMSVLEERYTTILVAFLMLRCHTTKTADKNRKGVFFAFCAVKYFH